MTTTTEPTAPTDADRATAVAALKKCRDDLTLALKVQDTANDALREAVIEIRPTGLLTVNEMAAELGYGRNYIDAAWSASGNTRRGDDGRVVQTRAALPAHPDAQAVSEAIDAASRRLSKAGRARREAEAAVATARAERDRAIAMVYASKILGPSAIAAAVGVDRNHVGRIVARHGISPQFRPAAPAEAPLASTEGSEA